MPAYDPTLVAAIVTVLGTGGIGGILAFKRAPTDHAKTLVDMALDTARQNAEDMKGLREDLARSEHRSDMLEDRMDATAEASRLTLEAVLAERDALMKERNDLLSKLAIAETHRNDLLDRLNRMDAQIVELKKRLAKYENTNNGS